MTKGWNNEEFGRNELAGHSSLFLELKTGGSSNPSEPCSARDE
jgi:hypothetical protein